MKIIVALLTLLFLAGCCKRIYPVQTTTHDSVITTKDVRFRDTVIKIQPASAGLEVPIVELSSWPDGKMEQKKEGIAKASATLSTGNLVIKCDCDSQSIKARLTDSIINSVQKHIEIKTELVREKYVPKLTAALAWVGGVLGGAGILFLGFKIFWK